MGLFRSRHLELEGHLASFLTWITHRPEPSELVINGDFLDFVQASPWSGSELEDETSEGVPLCFSEQQSIDKLQAIGRAHPSVFARLKTFLAARDDFCEGVCGLIQAAGARGRHIQPLEQHDCPYY